MEQLQTFRANVERRTLMASDATQQRRPTRAPEAYLGRSTEARAKKAATVRHRPALVLFLFVKVMQKLPSFFDTVVSGTIKLTPFSTMQCSIPPTPLHTCIPQLVPVRGKTLAEYHLHTQ